MKPKLERVLTTLHKNQLGPRKNEFQTSNGVIDFYRDLRKEYKDPQTAEEVKCVLLSLDTGIYKGDVAKLLALAAMSQELDLLHLVHELMINADFSLAVESACQTPHLHYLVETLGPWLSVKQATFSAGLLLKKQESDGFELLLKYASVDLPKLARQLSIEGKDDLIDQFVWGRLNSNEIAQFVCWFEETSENTLPPKWSAKQLLESLSENLAADAGDAGRKTERKRM